MTTHSHHRQHLLMERQIILKKTFPVLLMTSTKECCLSLHQEYPQQPLRKRYDMIILFSFNWRVVIIVMLLYCCCCFVTLIKWKKGKSMFSEQLPMLDWLVLFVANVPICILLLIFWTDNMCVKRKVKLNWFHYFQITYSISFILPAW